MRDRVYSLLSPCPTPTYLSGGIINLSSGVLGVRWYLTYPLSYRQVAEMVSERGMDVHHTTVFRARAGVWSRNRQALPTLLEAD